MFVNLGVTISSPHMIRTGVPTSVIAMIERWNLSILMKDMTCRQAKLEADNKLLHEKLDKNANDNNEKFKKLPEQLYQLFKEKEQPHDVVQTGLNAMHLEMTRKTDNMAVQMVKMFTDLRNEMTGMIKEAVQQLQPNQNNKKRSLVDLSSSARQTMPRVQKGVQKRAKIPTFQYQTKCSDAWKAWWHPDSECNFYQKNIFKGNVKSSRLYNLWASLFKAFVFHLTDDENVKMKEMSENGQIPLPTNLDDLFELEHHYISMLGEWFESEGVPVNCELLDDLAPQSIYNILIDKKYNYKYPNTIQRNNAMKKLQSAQEQKWIDQEMSESEQ